MKILNYLLVIATLPFFVACQKGVAEASVIYANVSFGNRTGVALQLTADEMPAKTFGIQGLSLPLTAGIHKLRFAEGDKQLLDTTIVVPVSAKTPAAEYAVFRPDASAALQLWSFDALGMNNVAAPPAGYFTISIINTDPRLPDEVDVHVFANIWINGQPQEVEVGVVKAVSRKAFSPFTNIHIGGANAANYPSNKFVIHVKDPKSGTTLQSINYENKITKIAPEDPICFIYTAYLAGNRVNTLLEK